MCRATMGYAKFGSAGLGFGKFGFDMLCFQIDKLRPLRFPWDGRMSQDLWRPLRQFVYERDSVEAES